jgi:D-alanine transaminase
MSRFAYVNGRYVRHADAGVHIEDRGYQLADGVYEVWAVSTASWPTRRPLRAAGAQPQRTEHRPADEPGRPDPCSARPARRNRVRDGLVYLQVTRGVARRDHAFPAQARGRPWSPPRVRLISPPPRPRPPRASRPSPRRITAGAGATSRRWAFCPTPSPSRPRARRGAGEAWFVDAKGLVTEGLIDERLDRRRRGPAAHPRHQGQYPARGHPAPCIGAFAARARSRDRGALHRR